MAAQNTDIIDLRRSYIPQDPNAFPVTMQTTQAEDSPEQRIPVLPYDGYNFMPTPQGYASFFGVNANVDNLLGLYHQEAVAEIPEVPPTYGPDSWEWPENATEAAVKAWIIGPEFYAEPDWQSFLTNSWGYDTQEELLADYPEYGNDIRAFIYYEAWGIPADFIAEFGADVVVIPGDLIDPGSPAIPAIPYIQGINEDDTDAEIDDIFIIQTDEFANIIVVLADNGIWEKRPNIEDTGWVHRIELDVPLEHRMWSKCVIDNVVYVYRQAEETIWIASPDNDYVFTEATPTGINMAGQLGIFKAGGRLGFWDSENSTAWSSLTDKLAFGDSDALSAATIFQDIVGKIVVVLQHGDGFIIYCTKSIVLVRRIVQSAFLFSGSSIFNNNGISYRRETCFADPDTTHFAMTTQGFVEISNGQATVSMPEVATYLKKNRKPVYLQMLNGRYLHFQLLDPEYFLGRANFRSEVSAGSTYSFGKAQEAIEKWEDGRADNPCRALSAIEANAQTLFAFNTYGYTDKQQSEAGEIPFYEDKLGTVIPVADLNIWKNKQPPGSAGFFGWHTYFYENVAHDAAYSIAALPDSADDPYLWLPGGMVHAAGFTQSVHTEDNQNNFYSKQEFLWWAQRRYVDQWIYAFEHEERPKADSRFAIAQGGYSATAINTEYTQVTKHKTEPLIDLSFFSESNKYYGIADKSAWLQRSLTRQIIASIYEVRKVIKENRSRLLTQPGEPAVWSLTLPIPWYHGAGSPNSIIADTAAEALAHANAYAALHGGSVATSTNPMRITVTAGPGLDRGYFPGDPPVNDTLPVWGDVYLIITTTYQSFQSPQIEYKTVDNCIIKELGHTKIIGHGHWDLAGGFVVDDNDAEAADYADQCDLTPPDKTKRITILGREGGNPWQGGLCGLGSTVEIDGETYEFDAGNPQIPASTIVLRDGSIEPLHPTFLGAFVFDIQYKKWGKMQQPHKFLLDLFPINNVAGAPVAYENFLPKSAALLPDGFIYPFDEYPEDSQLVFGKYGSHRHGFTDLQEVEIQHRVPMNGTISVEGSLNGRDVETIVTKIEAYENSRQHKLRTSLSARWYNVVIEGFFDLTYLALNSVRGSRR